MDEHALRDPLRELRTGQPVVGLIYDEVEQRPNFIVCERVGFDADT